MPDDQYNHLREDYDSPFVPTGTYRGEEIEVTFTALAVQADYGVRGSPVWTEYADGNVCALSVP
jgi:hypothetical protein